MKNSTLDNYVFLAVRAGIGFRKDIVNRLTNDGVLLEGATYANTQIVDNSLQRLRVAKKIHYVSAAKGWKELSS